MPYTRAMEGKSQNQTTMWLVCHGGVVVWRSLLLLRCGLSYTLNSTFSSKQHAVRDMESMALGSTFVQGPVAQG